MPYYIGIDEAAVAPPLGPFAATVAAFESAGEPDDLWQALSPVVSKKCRKNSIVVDDSKKTFTGKSGFARSEESVLAFLRLLVPAPKNFEHLLAALEVGNVGTILATPWLNRPDAPLPAAAPETGCAFFADLLEKKCEKSGVKPVFIRSVVATATEFNQNLKLTNNKSLTLFHFIAKLFEHLKNLPGRAYVFVDHQGGRQSYKELLEPHFRGFRIVCTGIGEEQSTYRIHDGSRRIDLAFLTNAEAKHLPVALASMTSKYLRELSMSYFNDYFGALSGNCVKPTKGYPTDAKRWLAEMEKFIDAAGIDRLSLVRLR